MYTPRPGPVRTIAVGCSLGRRSAEQAQAHWAMVGDGTTSGGSAAAADPRLHNVIRRWGANIEAVQAGSPTVVEVGVVLAARVAQAEGVLEVRKGVGPMRGGAGVAVAGRGWGAVGQKLKLKSPPQRQVR